MYRCQTLCYSWSYPIEQVFNTNNIVCVLCVVQRFCFFTNSSNHRWMPRSGCHVGYIASPWIIIDNNILLCMRITYLKIAYTKRRLIKRTPSIFNISHVIQYKYIIWKKIIEVFMFVFYARLRAWLFVWSRLFEKNSTKL